MNNDIEALLKPCLRRFFQYTQPQYHHITERNRIQNRPHQRNYETTVMQPSINLIKAVVLPSYWSNYVAEIKLFISAT